MASSRWSTMWSEKILAKRGWANETSDTSIKNKDVTIRNMALRYAQRYWIAGKGKRLRLAALAGPVSLEVVTENFLQFFFADNRSALAGDLTYLINSGRQ